MSPRGYRAPPSGHPLRRATDHVPPVPDTPEWRQVMRAGMGRIPHRYLPPWVGPAWTWFIVLGCLNRGSDLAAGPDRSGSELNAWTNVIGNNAYGWAMLAAAVLVATAKLGGRVGPLIIALTITAAVYVTYSIALLQGVFAQPGNITGWRFGGATALFSLLVAGRVLALLPVLRGTYR